MPDFATDRAAAAGATFLKSKGVLVAAGAAGAGGVVVGVHHAKTHPEDSDPLLAQAVGTGIVAAGVGAGLFAARKPLWSGTKKATRAFSNHTASAVKEAGKEAGFARVFLGRPVIAGSLGAGIGAFVGSQVSDDPKKGALAGAGIGGGLGMVAFSGMKLGGAWKKTPGPVKALGFVAAAAAAGVGIRAFAHEEQAGSEDHAVNDGTGGYAAAPGVRERARSMNVSGNMVFGLNARRH